MEFPNRQERQHLLFMSAAEKIKSLGYEVYASVLKNETIDKAHYGYFVKDNRIGYFQADMLGFVIEFTTVYKPSAKHGCGEKIEENYSPEHITDSLLQYVITPEFGFYNGEFRSKHNLYDSFDEYMQKNNWCKYIKI